MFGLHNGNHRHHIHSHSSSGLKDSSVTRLQVRGLLELGYVYLTVAECSVNAACRLGSLDQDPQLRGKIR